MPARLTFTIEETIHSIPLEQFAQRMETQLGTTEFYVRQLTSESQTPVLQEITIVTDDRIGLLNEVDQTISDSGFGLKQMRVEADGAADELTKERLKAHEVPPVNSLPPFEQRLKVFVSYKWESEEHVAWVKRLAKDLRKSGIDAKLDQWEVKYGGSFTDYMQHHITDADVFLFVITPGSVAAAEAPEGKGGALKFEVQMMNARRMAEGTRIIGIYRSGDRPPNYLRDHRYVDFREDNKYDVSVASLVADLLGKSGPPPLG